MKSVLLALAAASSVAAQLDITLPAEYNLVNAIDPKDPEYTACTVAENVVEACVVSAGGTAAIRTADPTKLLNCLCCAGPTAISPLYSICSTYLADEAPRYRTEADSFGDFYSLCGLGATCTVGVGGGNSAGSSTPRTTPAATRSPTPTPTPTTTGTGSGSGSSRRASVTATTPDPNVVYPPVCEDMIAIFTSCTAKFTNFMSKPYREQAECYCCRTGRNGAVTWTDELDNYGKTCASWAITGEPVDAYPVAETFASFCQNFPNACQAAATTTSGTRATGSSSGGGGSGSQQGDVTVTVTPTSTNAANGLPAGCGAAVVAGAAALAFAL